MIRYRVFGRAVGERVSWRAALDATVANFFFSWITPGAALGAPAAIVMLGRRGVSWDAAALIAFGKSLTGTALLILLAFAMLAIGLGPDLDRGTLAVFTTGIGVVAPNGVGRQAFGEAIVEGRSGVSLIESFDTSNMPIILQTG